MKSLFISLFISLCCYAVVVVVGELSSIEWDKFQVKYNKSYENEMETAKSYNIFNENLQIIIEHNLKYDDGSSFKMTVNQYTDKTSNEVQLHELTDDDKLNMNIEGMLYHSEYFQEDITAELPKDMDWRLKGAVTIVKNQLPCGMSRGYLVNLNNNTILIFNFIFFRIMLGFCICWCFRRATF